MADTLNDNDNELLDEDLDEQIKETKGELNSINNPMSIESGTDFDPQMIEDFYEKIKKMPRDKMASLLANLGKTHSDLGENHQFNTMSENSQKSNKQRLREKLCYLQMKRKPKIAISQELEKIEKQTKVQEHKSKEQDVLSQDNENENESNTSDKPKTMSKSQKKRLREKAKKSKKIIDSVENVVVAEATDATDATDAEAVEAVEA